MAVDKLVDSTQLDSDLTSVANAIRTKGGTSAQMAFPAGFISAVQAIPTGVTPTGTKQINIIQNGTTTEDVAAYANAEITVNVQGGYALDDIADCSEPSGALRLNLVPGEYAFYGRTNITSVYARGLQPTGGWNYTFQNCSGITKAVVGAIGNNFGTSAFRGCSNLEVLDYEGVRLRNQIVLSCTKLAAIVLRNTGNICGLENTGVFTGTPFASGGTGGTLYVPQSMISAYQADATWSTILGYTNNSIQAIEGSQYENAYADGTPIS